MRIIVDESVALVAADALAERGHEFTHAAAALVSMFFDRHRIEEFRGRLVTLSPHEMRIR